MPALIEHNHGVHKKDGANSARRAHPHWMAGETGKFAWRRTPVINLHRIIIIDSYIFGVKVDYGCEGKSKEAEKEQSVFEMIKALRTPCHYREQHEAHGQCAHVQAPCNEWWKRNNANQHERWERARCAADAIPNHRERNPKYWQIIQCIW